MNMLLVQTDLMAVNASIYSEKNSHLYVIR